MSIKYLDMFSGIGGFRSGLEKVGSFECVGYCEIDEYARRAYEAMYNTKGEMYFEDATKSIPMTYPISTLLQEVFPVNHFQSQGEETDLMRQEERSSLKLLELLPLKGPLFCSLKMFPDCFRMTKAGHLLPSLMHWMKLGMMSHGLSLTAQTLVFPNPAIECSLPDFLEENAGAKYSLSAKQIQRLLSDECREVKVIEFTQLMDSQLPLQQAAVEAEEKQDSI